MLCKSFSLVSGALASRLSSAPRSNCLSDEFTAEESATRSCALQSDSYARSCRVICYAQESRRLRHRLTRKRSQSSSRTRFDIPLDQSPASVSVITSEDFEQKQIERVGDALREVPGLSVVQTGTAGPAHFGVHARIAQRTHAGPARWHSDQPGPAGRFNFADLTIDNIDRIEVVRGPQSTFYGPRALAGVIQLFTKQGNGTPGDGCRRKADRTTPFANGVRATESRRFDYSVGVSRLDTDNARPNNQLSEYCRRSRTSAGRLTNNCASAVCSLIPSATPEIRTRSSIRSRSIISSPRDG